MIKKPSVRSMRDIQPPSPAVSQGESTHAWSKYLLVAVIAVAVVSVGGSVGFALLGNKSVPVPKGSVALNTNQVQSLIDKVSSHISVISGESPTVATIQNADVLKAQNPDFYRDAQNGDRLLIWSDKAVLFSSTQDKILSVLPIRLPSASEPGIAQAASAPVATAPVAESALIEVRNGTKTVGLAKSVAEKMTAAGLDVTSYSTAKTNAANTMVIVKDGKSLPQTVSHVLQLTNGRVSTLPAGEAAMKGDILVIVGADYR